MNVVALVSPEACGRGIGKQLMEWAESAALPLLRKHHPSLQCCKLCLWVRYLLQLLHCSIMAYVIGTQARYRRPHQAVLQIRILCPVNDCYECVLVSPMLSRNASENPGP